MAIELRVPALGESVREATLGAWKHAEGDAITVEFSPEPHEALKPV